jgi:hypothetical protein
MKEKLLLIIALFAFQFVFSQAPISTIKSIPFDYDTVQYRPVFPGGYNELIKFIGKSFEASEDEGPSGVIKVSFIIERDGGLSEIKITKDLGDGTLGKELIRVISKSPKWIPGMNDDKPVRVLYELPITIK